MMSEDVLENTIKVQRAKMNLTQEQLAELIGVTRKTVNTIENGKFIPSTVLAIKMARVLGLPVEELFILK
ncbi:helix-turn-helix transcriptional regulator [Paenibacillus sp. VCA1]|uniref:helix-turn-helix transcriptional regulator n=1 Tax=Paenibacillus sp. VCA1 TaxID=3039148 RepID=UPI0028722EA0|nr:helix-turn-helix transcriptional regulator [Paenibacillus sp. VCA1]MDR9856416.1 helix-turn-helix transcriptional regulator [Paenibacillus sp. VCA1]